MSVSYYSYIGPVLEVTDDPVPVVYEKTACPNKHKVDNHDRYCKQCGEKTIKEEQIKKEKINIRNDDETGILDDLVCVNDSINKFIFDDMGITLYDWKDDSYDGIKISPDTLADIEKKFYNDQKVQDMILYLEDKYGKEIFNITFKFMIYYS